MAARRVSSLLRRYDLTVGRHYREGIAPARSSVGLVTAATVITLAAIASSCTETPRVLRSLGDCADALILTPSDSIQDAVDAADDGDTICLAAGTYAQTLVVPDVTMTIVGVDGWEQTIIDAERRARTIVAAPGETQLTIEGVTVTGGLALPSDAPSETDPTGGAGVYLPLRNAELRSVRVTDNLARGLDVAGVGVFAIGGQERLLTLTDVRIDNNVALATAPGGDLTGTGVASVLGESQFSGVLVHGNRTEGDTLFGTVEGGGAYVFLMHPSDRITVVDNRVGAQDIVRGAGMWILGAEGIRHAHVADNQGTAGTVLGGGVYAFSTIFEDVDVVNNRAEATQMASGGGIYLGGMLLGGGGTLIASRMRLLGNRVVGPDVRGGGAAFDTGRQFLDNVVIAGNELDGSASESGAGIDAATHITLDQSVVALNGSRSGAAAIVTARGTAQNTIHNSVISGHDRGVLVFGPGVDPLISFTGFSNAGVEVEGVTGVLGTNGNVEVEPNFVATSGGDPLSWDFRLSGESMLRDAGDPGISDADGSASDVGAYGGPLGDGWRPIDAEVFLSDVP